MPDQSVAGTDPDLGATPPPGLPPLGQPNGTEEPVVTPPKVSIVDTILDLDALMSADVRRAEGTARFALRPDLEADIDELEAELEQLTDRQGNPLPTPDRAVGEVGDDGEPVRTAYDVALEIQTKRAELGASFKSVRMRQIPDEDWLAFEARWKKATDDGPPYPVQFWNELIAMSAFLPKIPIERLPGMRKKLGHPPMDVLGKKAWEVNAIAGVSIPKSPLSSAVLKLRPRTGS
jgi:hypothetical protein